MFETIPKGPKNSITPLSNNLYTMLYEKKKILLKKVNTNNLFINIYFLLTIKNNCLNQDNELIME